MKNFIAALNPLFTKVLKKIIIQIRHWGIFKRLIISSLIVILIPNAIIGLFSFSKFSTEMDSTISKYSYKTLYSLDTSITERFKKYTDLTYNLYLNDELKDLLRKCATISAMNTNNASQQEEYNKFKNRIGNIIFGKSSSLSGIANIEIVSDYDEFIQINYNNEPAGGEIIDIDRFRDSESYNRALEAFNTPIWWDTSKEKSMYKVHPYTSAYLGNYITVLKAIPEAGSGKTLGVIVINISLQALSDMFSYRDQYTQKGDLILISDSGIIQYFNPTPYFVKLDAATTKEVVTLNTDSIVRKVSDKDYLISAIKSDHTGWTLCSVVPRSSLLQSVYEIRTLIIEIGIICIVIAFILSYIVALSISRPIKKLKNAMEKIDETNIEIIYNDDIHDEVGVLGRKFNSMIKRIQNLINTVYEAELNKKEEMLRRKDAELDALQMQINPHFLYNTLDIIRWQIMAQENGENKASKMLSSFSDLLRLGTKKSSNLVEISEELDHVRAYIDVVRFDLEYELRVKYIINDDEINICKIPKLTFQPLIENIIVHGFAHKRDPGEILIEACIKEDVISIEITDNGEGIPADLLNSINRNISIVNEKSKSIGLRNVNERIKLYFGEQYGLEINSVQNHCTKAIIRIPIIK